MGTHAHYFIGPYVRCTYRKEMEDVQITTCPNVACVRHGKADDGNRFCPQCGTPRGEKTVKRPYFPRVSDVIGDDVMMDLDGNSRHDKYLYLTTNTTRTPRAFSLESETLHLDLGDLDRDAEMRWLAGHHAEELRLLRAAFDDVIVCWGLHKFWW